MQVGRRGAGVHINKKALFLPAFLYHCWIITVGYCWECNCNRTLSLKM